MIIIKNLSVHMQGEPLFEKVSIRIGTNDRIGIVGSNGSGKTTFLRAVAGLVEPDEGSVKVEQERIGYMPQDLVFSEDETIGSFIATVPPSMRDKVIKEVGLGQISGESMVSGLSGGQKRRLSLAKVLGMGPTLLLLDEPTNHLDRDTVDWLEDFIQNFKGGVVLISHDRSLLDHTVTKILEIDSRVQEIKEYTGNYSAYLLERAKRDQLQNEAYNRQQKEKKRLEAWLVRKREEARVFADPSKGKMIRAKEKYLQREIIDKAIVRAGEGRKIQGAKLEGEVANAKLMCRVSSVAKKYGDTSVLRDVTFEIRGKDRLLLTGANGSGKTTLLKMIMGEIVPDEGVIKIGENVSVGYFAQEQESLDLQKSILEEFLDTPDLVSGREARAVLGSFLFSDQDVFKKVVSLSLGERVRLIFAKLTNQKNELLVLDEPTNHLDIPSREVIEAALMEYEGSIIAVSHDRFFVEKIGFDRVLQVHGGKVEEVR